MNNSDQLTVLQIHDLMEKKPLLENPTRTKEKPSETV